MNYCRFLFLRLKKRFVCMTMVLLISVTYLCSMTEQLYAKDETTDVDVTGVDAA